MRLKNLLLISVLTIFLQVHADTRRTNRIGKFIETTDYIVENYNLLT